MYQIEQGYNHLKVLETPEGDTHSRLHFLANFEASTKTTATHLQLFDQFIGVFLRQRVEPQERISVGGAALDLYSAGLVGDHLPHSLLDLAGAKASKEEYFREEFILKNVFFSES